LTNALGRCVIGPALRDVITGVDDEVAHKRADEDSSYDQPSVERENKAHPMSYGDDEVTYERGVVHQGVEVLLVALLGVTVLPDSIPGARGMGVLQQTALGGTMEPAQKLPEPRGVAGPSDAKQGSGDVL